jgi:DNA-binding LytR/AlgR family response regulator
MTLLNFVVVGYFNLFYTYLIFRMPYSFANFFYFELITVAVGVLPVSFIVIYRHNRLLAANLKTATEMNAGLYPAATQPESSFPASESIAEHPTKFVFISESGNEQIRVAKPDFLFAAAADNYVELHYLENGVYKKSLIRSSLTKIEQAVSAALKVVRSHRAYIVNLEQVKHVSGNAQGLKLELNGTAAEVPVSRKMVPHIKALLHG